MKTTLLPRVESSGSRGGGSLLKAPTGGWRRMGRGEEWSRAEGIGSIGTAEGDQRPGVTQGLQLTGRKEKN